MKKITKLINKYGLVSGVIFCVSIIVIYFYNIMFVQNEEDILNILVLSSQADSEMITENLESVIEMEADEEIVVKYMDTSIEANRAIVLTWIRAKTVDVIISDDNQLDFFAENACLMDMSSILQSDETVEVQGEEKYYSNSIIKYDSEGNVIGRQEDANYGIYVKEIAGIELIKSPILSVSVNYKNKNNTMVALDYFVNRK